MNRIQRTLLRIAGLSWLVDSTTPRQRFQRPWEPTTLGPSYLEISKTDLDLVVSDSLRLYYNLGPVKGAIDDKAMYSVGRAWCAKSESSNSAWAEKAEEWVNEYWYPMADARGNNYDFKTDLMLMSISIDREGEIFVMLTESPDGWPLIQLVPTRMIGTRDVSDEGILKDGPYAGMRFIQGVVFNDVGRAVGFKVLGRESSEDKWYSARDVIQVFDPVAVDQVHGYPGMMHAILDLKDLRSVQGYERIAAQLMSQIGLIEENELGGPDLNDPSVTLNQTTPVTGPVEPSIITQETHGVVTRFFRAGSQSKLQQLKSERPGAAVNEFMDRLLRNACTGFGWPFELTWDTAKLGGANTRLLLARAMRSVEDRQDLLRPVARRCVGYAVAKAIKLGFLEPDPEWYKWCFTLPPRMTADYGRDANADRADYEAGLTTMTDILAEEGISLDDHIEKLKDERAKLAAAGITPSTTLPNERP